MPILKNITIDEFQNVTVMVIKDISMRRKLIDGRVHIAVSEADKSASENMFQNTETETICISDTCHNIDMLIDIPNEKSLQQLIDYLIETKKEFYGQKEVENG